PTTSICSKGPLGVFSTPLKMASISSGVPAPSAAARRASRLIAAHILGFGLVGIVYWTWSDGYTYRLYRYPMDGLRTWNGSNPCAAHRDIIKSMCLASVDSWPMISIACSLSVYPSQSYY